MPKQKCKFIDDLKKRFKCFTRGRDERESECLVCKSGTYVSVANKGAADLTAHINSEKHKQSVQGESFSSKLTNYFVKSDGKSEIDVAVAEGTFAFHTVKHHNSYNSMNCTSVLLKSVFHDSEIAKKISSARTKTEVIIYNVLAPYSVEAVLNSLDDNNIAFFGAATDGSNHDSIKVFPIQY